MNAPDSRSPTDGPDSAPIAIGFVLLPDFPLMAYAAAVEPLRAVNARAGRTLYRWWHASDDDGVVNASQGLSVTPDATLARDGPDATRIFICAGGMPGLYRNERLFAALRRLARAGRPALGGISGGPFILARAGLLDGLRCTLHWEHIPAFSETFPKVQVARSLFEIDRDRITCSGGIAAFDMMLELVTRDYGDALARAVSDWFLHNRMREGPSPQRMEPALRFGVRDERLVRVIDTIDRNLDRRVARSELAETAHLSERQLERLFQGVMGCTTHDYALRQRLAHASRLRRETALGREEIAQAAGFASASELRRVERRYAPRDD